MPAIWPFLLGLGAVASALGILSGILGTEKSKKSVLDLNLESLSINLDKLHDKKKISIVGQPGAGKSTLLLNITNGKCKPKPVLNQKTDATNWSQTIKDDFFHYYSNLMFVDLPGYDTEKHPVQSYLKYFPFSKFNTHLFIIKDKIHESDEKVYRKIIESGCPFYIIRCFSENLTKKEMNALIKDYNEKFENMGLYGKLLFVSNRTLNGIDILQKIIK